MPATTKDPDNVSDAVAADEAARGMMLCAYEIARERRIRENQAELVRLGLASTKAAMVASSDVSASAYSSSSSSSSSALTERKSKRKRKKRLVAVKPSTAPTRKSRRIAGKNPVGGAVALDDSFQSISLPDSPDCLNEKRLQAEIEEARRAKYKRLLDRHTNAGQDLPPRATYAHTVHRVLTMSEKALANRVKAIERAAGMYAVVKMRMFAECLLIEGYDDLSNLAQKALKRLLSLPRFKGTARHCRRVYKQAKK